MTGLLLRTGSASFHRLISSGSLKSALSDRRNDAVSPQIRRSGSSRISAMIFETEDLGTGAGFGDGRRHNDRGGSGNGRDDRNEYYQRMLKANPCDALLLRNYGKYLHEVEKDLVGAEECYGRAILASPGDGELLSLYGGLIWETQRDGERARSYFDQAVLAAPDDCSVLGSYARFLWEAEEEDEDEEVMTTATVSLAS